VKDMGMTLDQFIIYLVANSVNIEGVVLRCNPSVKNDVQKQIAQLLGQLIRIFRIDSIQDLISLLNKIRFQGFMILCLVPGAAIRPAKFGHYFYQTLKPFHPGNLSENDYSVKAYIDLRRMTIFNLGIDI
jgi:hypothetical protein